VKRILVVAKLTAAAVDYYLVETSQPPEQTCSPCSSPARASAPPAARA